MDVPVQRKVRPILAFLANFVSLGLGYVYVGEPRLAAIIVGGYFGLAVPGDTIKGRNGVLYRNGQVINEPYVHAPNPDPGYARDFGPNILGKDDVFVLGDYRNNSLDSRTWGAIPIRNLHGRAQFVWFSWGNAGVRWNRLGISLRR